MATITFDTLKAANVLKEHGYTDQQVQGFVEVITKLEAKEVATKQFVSDKLSTQTMWVAGLLIGQVAVNAGMMALMFNLYS